MILIITQPNETCIQKKQSFCIKQILFTCPEMLLNYINPKNVTDLMNIYNSDRCCIVPRVSLYLLTKRSRAIKLIFSFLTKDFPVFLLVSLRICYKKKVLIDSKITCLKAKIRKQKKLYIVSAISLPLSIFFAFQIFAERWQQWCSSREETVTSNSVTSNSVTSNLVTSKDTKTGGTPKL